MRKQHRTGRSIVRLADPAWTTGATGRRALHLELSLDQGAASWVQDPGSEELVWIAKAISAAAREAHDVEGRT